MDNPKKVVIIDDNEDLSKIMKRALEDSDRFTATTAKDAPSGRELCLKEQPDLILLDLVFPGGGGEQFMEFLKEGPELKNIPIIVLSGKGEMTFLAKKNKWIWQSITTMEDGGKVPDILSETKQSSRIAEALGVEDFLLKPFALDLLLEVVGEVLKSGSEETSEEDGDDSI